MPSPYNSFNNQYILNTGGFTINTPFWMTVPEMNSSVGLTTDPAQYQALLDQATRARGIANRGAFQRVAAQSYDQMRSAQSEAMYNMRSMQARAILNGGARGISAASQMLMRLGMNQQNSQQMTALRQQQAQTYLDENAELAGNTALAVEYTDTQRQFLGGLARDRYTVDMNSAVGAAQAASQIVSAREAAAAARYTADVQANAMIQAARGRP